LPSATRTSFGEDLNSSVMSETNHLNLFKKFRSQYCLKFSFQRDLHYCILVHRGQNLL
jgi:hypothetical protein